MTRKHIAQLEWSRPSSEADYVPAALLVWSERDSVLVYIEQGTELTAPKAIAAASKFRTVGDRGEASDRRYIYDTSRVMVIRVLGQEGREPSSD